MNDTNDEKKEMQGMTVGTSILGRILRFIRGVLILILVIQFIRMAYNIFYLANLMQ